MVRTGLFAEVDLLAHVVHAHLLRRGDDHGAVDARSLEVLHDGDVLVGGAYRGRQEIREWQSHVSTRYRPSLSIANANHDTTQYSAFICVCSEHTRRRVDDEVVQLAPDHVREELLDQSVLAWPSPNDGVIFGRKHEADRHDCQVLLHVDW